LALTKRPEIRYQDGEQFAADLRQVAAGMDIADIADPFVPPKGVAEEGFATTQKMMAPSLGNKTTE